MPLEILTNIIRNLPLKDIKNLRQACRTLDSIAVHFLFKEIYLSSQLRDRERLTAVSEHPIFSKSVEKVIYDSTFITPRSLFANGRMNKSNYLNTCYPGLGGKDYTRVAVLRGFQSFEASYLQQETLADYDDDELTHRRFEDSHPSNFSSLLESIEDFPKVAQFLPDDLIRLVQSLPRMPNVRHFEISDCRYTRDPDRYRRQCVLGGSSSVRDMTFCIRNEGTRGVEEVILDPRPWFDQDEVGRMRIMSSCFRGFYVLTQAASMTKRENIESFRVLRDSTESGLPSQTFFMRTRQLYHAEQAFCYLKSIKLKICHVDMVHPFSPNRFSTILASAKQLKDLDICLDHKSSPASRNKIPTFNKIIGIQYWPELRSATFGSMNLGDASFLHFCRNHRHTLTSLRLERVSLPSNLTDQPDDGAPPLPKWHRMFKAMAHPDSVLSVFTFRDIDASETEYLHSCGDRDALYNFLESGGASTLPTSCLQGKHEVLDEEES